MDKAPFPWEGASDTRIRLADEVVNDNVRVLRAAMARLTVQASPVESGDTMESAAVTTFMKWLLHQKMKQNLRREIPLLVNWQENFAASVLAITWDEEVQTRKIRVGSLELHADMTKMAADPATAKEGAMGLEMLNALFDKTREDEVAAWLRSMHEALGKGAARRAVRQLREKGECVVPDPIVVRSQPLWTALRVMRDVFFPANTFDLQKSPWVAFREPITPEELRSRVLTDDYNEDVVEDAITRCLGKTLLDSVRYDNERAQKAVVDDVDGLVEVMHFHRKSVDADGYLKIEVTSFVPGIPDALKKEDSDYRHREYPCVDFICDRTERIIIDNRSVPSRIETQQQEVKTQRDYRADRASVSIMPPVKVPMARANVKLTFGPAAQIPERRPGEIAWMSPPQMDGDTVNLEKQVRADVDSYFGRMSEAVAPQRQALYQQSSVDDFLGGMQQAVKQTLALARQYYDDALFARVTGVQMPFALSDEDVTGEWDVTLDFNAGDLNMEGVLAKLKVINEAVLPADTEGVVDRAGMIEWAMRSIDPSLSARIVRAAEPARNREREDEQMQFVKIAAGVEPEMKEGQNYALRVSELENIMKNPQLQQRYATDEIFRKLVDTRKKHFEFQMQQRQNAQIGRMGAAPVLGRMAG